MDTQTNGAATTNTTTGDTTRGTTTTGDTTRGTTTTGDVELTVLTKISKLLNSLDDSGRSRVVRYFAEKFGLDFDLI